MKPNIAEIAVENITKIHNPNMPLFFHPPIFMLNEAEVPSKMFAMKTIHTNAILSGPPIKKTKPIAIASGIPSNRAPAKVVNP